MLTIYCHCLRTDHVEVGERADNRPEHAACLHGLDPHGISEQHAEDSDPLVVIGTRYRAGNVPRNNRDHSSGN